MIAGVTDGSMKRTPVNFWDQEGQSSDGVGSMFVGVIVKVTARQVDFLPLPMLLVHDDRVLQAHPRGVPRGTEELRNTIPEMLALRPTMILALGAIIDHLVEGSSLVVRALHFNGLDREVFTEDGGVILLGE